MTVDQGCTDYILRSTITDADCAFVRSCGIDYEIWSPWHHDQPFRDDDRLTLDNFEVTYSSRFMFENVSEQQLLILKLKYGSLIVQF